MNDEFDVVPKEFTVPRGAEGDVIILDVQTPSGYEYVETGEYCDGGVYCLCVDPGGMPFDHSSPRLRTELRERRQEQMATQTKILPDGTECQRVIVKDEENEVRVHLHKDDLWPKGLEVVSASLGVLCRVGDVVGECD